MRASILILAVLLLLSSCKTQTKVSNVRETNEPANSALIYALPRTVLHISVELTRDLTIPGPFAQYAEKLLNIKDVAAKEKSHWYISKATINSAAEADPTQFYWVQPNSNTVASLLTLTQDGLLAGINMPAANNTENLNADNGTGINVEKNKTQLFKNLTTKKVTEKQSKQSEKHRRDSTKNDKTEKKSLEQQAQEAVDYLIKLRKRHNKLLAGIADQTPDGKGLENNKFPDGESIKFMDVQLDSIEQEILSLFTGKILTEKFEAYYEFLPDNSNKLTPNVLAYFSNVNGMVESNDQQAKPIMIEINKTGKTNAIEEYIYKQVTQKKIVLKNTSFRYRIPDVSVIKLYYEGKAIAEKKILIAQYGSIVSLPAYLLKNKNIVIEFFPETGALKRISEKN